MLTHDKVSLIKACEGVYKAADVARAYGVHRSTITRIWNGQAHADLSPATDFPDIATRRADHDDIATLLSRGEPVAAVAAQAGVSTMTVYRVRQAMGGVWL